MYLHTRAMVNEPEEVTHKGVYITLVCLAAIVFVVALVFNGLATMGKTGTKQSLIKKTNILKVYKDTKTIHIL